MKTTTLTRLFSTAAVIGALAAPAAAQEEAAAPAGITVNASLSLDYVTQYFFRGFEQLDGDQGIVLQPGAEFSMPVNDSITATIGTWGSIHTDTPGAGSNPSSWYEQDIYASVSTEIEGFEVSAGLTYYTFPSAAANGDITELNLSVSFDDSEYLGDFAFNPTVEVAIELQNNLDPTGENDYLGIGGAFSLDPLTEGTEIEAWSWSVPVTLGLSLDDYYTDASGADETFGFLEIGAEGSIALSELIGTEEYFGAWDLTVGAYVLLLNTDVVLTDDRGGSSDNIQYYAKVGISRSW